jgi:hypothetical protein
MEKYDTIQTIFEIKRLDSYFSILRRAGVNFKDLEQKTL